jgi:EmrB/QacA subfamily drug resistance transporter
MAGPAPSAPAASGPLQGSALWWGTLSLSLATFMNVLDSSIANVSIPAISGDLGVSPSQGTWVITSFGVANAISVPLTGWLTQRFGAVRLFVTSVWLFVLASALCGLAHSLEALVAFRVLQGLVAGPMIPLSQTLLLSSYPPNRSGMALALWGMTTLVAPVVGPLLGGWITDHMSWPWIFYINIPVGVASALMTWGIYHKRETPVRKLPIDAIGLALLVLWVGALQLMLDKGKELDWFASGQITLLAVLAGVGFAVFLVWELTEDHPVVDLRLFKGRNFGFGALSLSVAYSLFFGNVVLLPLWLQQWMGYTATSAGMAMAPVGLLAILLTPQVGLGLGPAQNCHRCVHRFFIGVVDAFAVHHRDRSLAHLATHLVAGRRDGHVFHPADDSDIGGHRAGPHPFGRRPEQFHTHHCRCHGHLDCNHRLGLARLFAPCPFDRGFGGRARGMGPIPAKPAGRRLEPRAGLGAGQPDDRPAGLHAGCRRCV